RRRLWWLVAGRGGLALALLLASGAQPLGAGVAWRGLPSAAVAMLLLTFVYAGVLRFTRLAPTLQAGAQLAGDTLVVTWLIAVGGDLHSPYAALYLVIISLASVFLGVRGALVCSVGCAVAYTCVMLAIGFGRFGQDAADAAASTTTIVSATGLYDLAFLVVGLLAAQLAVRQTRSDVQLIAATHALASLRALHERIVESIRSGVVTTDLAGRIYTCNAAAEEITGHAAEALRGEEASILFGPLAGRIEESLRAAKDDQLSPRYEADCLTPDGLRVRLGYTISPLAGDRSEPRGLVISFQDLTHVR